MFRKKKVASSNKHKFLNKETSKY